MKKVCSTCNISKPLSEFSKNKAFKDGLSYRCRKCDNLYCQQYHQKNKNTRAEYDKNYNKKNKKVIDEYMKELHMSEGYGVYKLTHLPTQYFYIGEGQLYQRRFRHLRDLKTGKNKCGLLQEHYNKHPNINEWQFEVIYKFDDYDKETGKELEAFVIEESREKYPTQVLNTRL
tara:strand:- start:154 stop:672 length:519 start_codon:yes stop_codon:yes gene_type:complete